MYAFTGPLEGQRRFTGDASLETYSYTAAITPQNRSCEGDDEGSIAL